VAFVSYLVVGITAYLLGSIPTGYLVARARRVDIRSIGSGNIGATNVFRTLGRTAGSFVLAVDFMKGLVACRLLAPGLSALLSPSLPADAVEREIPLIIAAVAAILGHNYTCFLHFRGGKGIATSAGVLTALVPWALLVGLGVWITLFALFRYVSLASIGASLTLPLAVWLTGHSLTLILITIGLAILALYKHRSNIQRLLNGTEHRIGSTPKPSTP
jgi:acyl phosphate:glycerol-3-phosphate acyltransferase